MATLPAVHTIDEAPGIVATVAQVDGWIETAAPGAVFVYASRTCMIVKSAGAKRMRELAERGLVQLTQRRDKDVPAIVNYVATRTSEPTAMTKPSRRQLSACVVDAEAALVDSLLPLLERAARFGRPCPTDKQLAERAKLAVETIQPGLAVLSAAGLIWVEAAPSPTRRRVLIVATGERTGLIR